MKKIHLKKKDVENVIDLTVKWVNEHNDQKSDELFEEREKAIEKAFNDMSHYEQYHLRDIILELVLFNDKLPCDSYFKILKILGIKFEEDER